MATTGPPGTISASTRNGWNITLTQPLFRWQNVVQYQQSEFQVMQAEAQFGQATQDLVLRVAQAYFDVLAAQDNIEFIKANRIAISEQLAQAKRNFEVGTATITDTNEAQARFDLAVAQEIARPERARSRAARAGTDHRPVPRALRSPEGGRQASHAGAERADRMGDRGRAGE